MFPPSWLALLLLTPPAGAVPQPQAAGSGAREDPAASRRLPGETCRLSEDSSTAAWQAIGRQYAKLADAMRRKDLDSLFALYAPSFEVDMRGEPAAAGSEPVWNREKSLAVQRERLAAVRQTRLISNTILELRDCGDRAIATVLQQWYRTQALGNVELSIQTVTVQDEEWIRTAQGWKRGNINHIRPGAWLVDGKRVDPAKGYDPDAPPFEPFPSDEPGR